MKLLCVLGRQPALGLAELESRFGANYVQAISNDVAQIDTDKDITIFSQLGSVQKAAEIIDILETTDWNKAARHIQKNLKELLNQLPEGKVTLGLSIHGLNIPPRQINATALSLKKVIKAQGRPARIVPNNEKSLNTAQVIHNKLTSENGVELVLVKHHNKLILARTKWVQDIEAYSRRDQKRPMRDSRVGMLPPKLAQIILNLAVGQSDNKLTVLDPFCGTGVLMQEAALAGHDILGTDIEPRMIEYTEKNLDWLDLPDSIEKEFTVADATSHNWRQKFDTIAAETYLGRALSSLPDQETLNKIISDCSQIHKKFFRNVARQTEPGFRMCVAVPAWRTKNGFKHMPVLDHLEELGYNQVSFVHAKTTDLVYHREDQIVARELIIVTRR